MMLTVRNNCIGFMKDNLTVLSVAAFKMNVLVKNDVTIKVTLAGAAAAGT